MIRDAVTEQARVEGVKVGEMLTRLVLDARAAGWSFASNTFANPSNTPDPERVRAAFGMVADMGRAGVPVQKGVGVLLNRLAKRELLDVLGSKPRTPAPALPAPEHDEA